MEKTNTAARLKSIMEERNLKQVDILKLCEPYCQKFGVRIGRNDLSQYVNAKVEPGQKKLTILGKALKVSEAWLMGYDVPMERDDIKDIINQSKEILDNFVPADYHPRILGYYDQLNTTGKKEAEKRVEELTHFDRYTKEEEKVVPLHSEDREIFVNAAHAIEGASEEDIQHDEDIMNDDDF